MTTEKSTWETFCDKSYYQMWAVRPTNEKRWGVCFHVPSKDEAASLAELLNTSNVVIPDAWFNNNT